MVKVTTNQSEIECGSPVKQWAYESAEYLLNHPNELSDELLTQLLEALVREQSSRLRLAIEALGRLPIKGKED